MIRANRFARMALRIARATKVARVAWGKKSFEATCVADVAAPVVKMAKLLSLMVHLASAAGDPHTLAIASSYIFVLMMANCIGFRPAAGWRSRVRRQVRWRQGKLPWIWDMHRVTGKTSPLECSILFYTCIDMILLFSNLPSDTKLLLTKNYFKIIIFGKLRISRVIP